MSLKAREASSTWKHLYQGIIGEIRSFPLLGNFGGGDNRFISPHLVLSVVKATGCVEMLTRKLLAKPFIECLTQDRHLEVRTASVDAKC